MAVDPTAIGTVLEPVSMDIERGRWPPSPRDGQRDPIYSDLDAAKNAGHRDLPVPPTFLFAIELELPDPFQWGLTSGSTAYVLHGGQDFTYHAWRMRCERLTATSTIADVYSKRGGAWSSSSRRPRSTDESGSPVAS